MSVVNDIATAVVAAASAVTGVREAIRFGGEPTPDAVRTVSLNLPGVMVTTLATDLDPRGGEGDPRKRQVDIALIIVAKAIPKEKSDKWANPSVQAWELEEPLTKLIIGNSWGLTNVVPATQPDSREIFPKGALKAGYAFLLIRWTQDYDLPPDLSIDDLNDLTDVVTEIDFAHLAPDGEDAPDGTVDHTTHIEDLDQ